MKIIQITPGSGDNFYCENCLRDLEMVKALRSQGHDVLMVPLYLPLQIKKDEGVANAPIFFGGVNVYLQQKFKIFQKTPRWLDRWLDSRKLLKWVAPKAGMTRARDLGETTLSMLKGEHGRQLKELNRLLDWLALEENKPDIVCLSNVLLAGLAASLKARLNVPVVCWLQDEECFVDALEQPYSGDVWELLRQISLEVMDGFVSVSEFYKQRMLSRLGVAGDKITVIPLGINVDLYAPAPHAPPTPVIGFLSRLCKMRGLDTLVGAFIQLKQRDEFSDLKLHIGGGSNAADEAFVASLKSQLDEAGHLADVIIEEDFTFEARHLFFENVSVMCVPETEKAAYALYVLEALIMGVPVVEPCIGAIPELLNVTGGGALYEGHSVDAVAQALMPLLRDADKARALGETGRAGVLDHYDIKDMATAIVTYYEDIKGQS
ncbi:MAG: glycosyltransferase family 4 protein [Planctomycetes bacterium]|nr:glycosyltransferase family 4 protein [Planctomycetota bacterium]